MAGNDIANFKNTMPKISFPNFPKFPTGGGSFPFAFEGAGVGELAVAVEGAGVAEGVIGLGNGGFSGFPNMDSLCLGLKMMEGSEDSNDNESGTNPIEIDEKNNKPNFIPYTAEMRKYIPKPVDEYQTYLEKIYIKIRKEGLNDVETVAKNTGLTVQEITDYKKHVFLDVHDKVSFDGKTYTTTYFQADPDLACLWTTAQKQELTQAQKEWFRQQANHELAEKALMDQGMPLRDVNTYNPVTKKYGSGAHIEAPDQPDSFPGITSDPKYDYMNASKKIKNIDDY